MSTNVLDRVQRDLRLGPDDWEAAVAMTDGSQLVVGGPGTGKTEFLVRRARYLVAVERVHADRLIALTFGRRGAADLGLRIRRERSTTAPAVPIRTFHSLAADIVERHATAHGWLAPPQILTGPEQTALVRELLQTEDAAGWSPAFRPLLASTTFAEEITDFVLRTSEQMLDPADVAARAAARADWMGLPEFVARYRAELRERGRIDYGLLLAEAAAIAEETAALRERFEYVLVDEFQDTTLAQVRLLAALTAHTRNLTVAADPYQSIYSFRGATVQNVARFPQAFPNRDGTPPTRILLTTSFRTPAAVLAAADRVAADDLPGAAGPVIPASGAGRVDVHVFEQQTAEAEWIADEIVRLHLTDHLPYGRMAVFVRSKRRFLAELSRALHRRRVPHDPPAARLAEQPAARFVLDLITAACGDPTGAGRALRRLILGHWFELALGTLHDLERMRTARALTWSEALRSAHPELAALAALLEDTAWAAEWPAAEGLWHVWSHLPQLAVIAIEDHRRAERTAWTSLSQVIGRWNQRNPGGTLVDYHRLVDDEEFEARPLLSYTPPDDDRLTVATLHQAKGLEFDVVFIADAVEGVFPDLRMRDSLLGVRHLLPDIPTETTDYRRFRLQEERRLAYTAMTRAGQRVVWTATSTGFDGGLGVPSRFLAMVAGSPTVGAAATVPNGESAPVTVAEAEATLRRTLADPEQPADRRLAALAVVAGGSRHQVRDPWTFAGVRMRGPDTGVIDGALHLTPSHADAYAGCPRRFVLVNRLGIGDRAGPHAELGRLIHAAIEHAERRALGAGNPHGTLCDAVAGLEEAFDRGAFAGEPHAATWRRRALVALESLYTRWPSRGRVVAVEHELSTEIGGVPWRGRVDRIEVDDGQLRIVDYKTSSTAVSLAAAAASLQLGFYVHAASRDQYLAALGRPVAAEFWFPYASRHQKTVAVRRFDIGNLQAVLDQLAAAAEGIRAEEWPALPSAGCNRCPVRSVCPAHPEGAEGFVP